MIDTALGLVVRSTEPKVVIPALIEHLRSFGERGMVKANWIEDVYSEVLSGLADDSLPDRTWIDDLLDVCCKQLNTVAESQDFHFGECSLGRWGWSEVIDGGH